MREARVTYFTKKEEEFINLLSETGTKKSVAKVLVYLANIPEATSRDIERGTDLRQPEVCLAMQHLISMGWVKSRENASESRGRPLKIYEMVKPINEIMDYIEKEKKKEADKQLNLVNKLRNYIK
jgi:predicted transcriptional regulator